MDYGSLIRRAWTLTWRHRSLWVLGLFAASTVGSCSPTGGGGGSGAQWRGRPEDLGRISPDAEEALRFGGRWVSANLDVVLIVAVVAALLGLALAVVSLVAQGGMARATAEVALDRPITLGAAWRVGARLFWRYLALWLLVIGLFIAIGLVLALFAGLALAASQFPTDPVRTILTAAAGLLALLAALAAIPVYIGLTIVVAFAQRAIAVEGFGPIAALGAAVRLVRGQLGTSALVWLVNLALAIGWGLAIAFGVVALLIPLGLLAAALIAITGVSAASILFLAGAVVAAIIAIWAMAAIANSFFWNYWTLAYLRFMGRLTDRLEPTTED
ncbi:MAG: DUF7544 domain-containing protein [Chloroflexota bacterium]